MNRSKAIKFIEFQLSIYERLPYKNKLRTLIDTLKLSLAALQDQEEREHPKQLTIEEMLNMDAPVWVSCYTHDGKNGYWCICQEGTIICPTGICFDVRDIPTWNFYRHQLKEK